MTTKSEIISIEYVSVQKAHSITVEIDLQRFQALINSINITQGDNVAELALLLRHVSDNLDSIGVKSIIQQVHVNDWENILKNISYFKYINMNEQHEFVNIMCSTKEFPSAFMEAIGYNPI